MSQREEESFGFGKKFIPDSDSTSGSGYSYGKGFNPPIDEDEDEDDEMGGRGERVPLMSHLSSTSKSRNRCPSTSGTGPISRLLNSHLTTYQTQQSYVTMFTTSTSDGESNPHPDDPRSTMNWMSYVVLPHPTNRSDSSSRPEYCVRRVRVISFCGEVSLAEEGVEGWVVARKGGEGEDCMGVGEGWRGWGVQGVKVGGEIHWIVQGFKEQRA